MPFAHFWLLLFVNLGVSAIAGPAFREVVYEGAVTMGGHVVPLYDKGFLVYLQQSNRLQVFRPDTQLAFDVELACPATGQCSASAVAVDGRSNIAVGFGYSSARGRVGGIRILDLKGQQTRFIETPSYVPTTLCFDRDGNLWVLGWQRDSLTGDYETNEDYSLVRKFSARGELVGEYLPRSLWPSKKSAPGAAGGGYWKLFAASDRIGLMVHESHADNPPEWVEWDLTGKLLGRSVLDRRFSASGGRAFTANGRLYARFRTGDTLKPELKVLDTSTGTWTPASDNVAPEMHEQGLFLLGADGEDLVYSVGHGNVRLIWARPELNGSVAGSGTTIQDEGDDRGSFVFN